MVVTNQHVVGVAISLLVRMVVINQHVVGVVINQHVIIMLVSVMFLLVQPPAYQGVDVINKTTIVGLAMVFIALQLVIMVATNQRVVTVVTNQHVVGVVTNLLVRMAVTNQRAVIAIPLVELKFVYYVVNHHDN